ncbi:hypothetical protein BD311DRAFT_756962 [Dichomitus squalens]|uniref:Uncharacterized protein n=1 Tax=Dichomitus squalens TaxID=114155 RepID=A0A4Q9MQ69_9APHY|nr:hypothetical protein BD311DRAFT_756962 [Dichomitus squalens]
MACPLCRILSVSFAYACIISISSYIPIAFYLVACISTHRIYIMLAALCCKLALTPETTKAVWQTR